MLIDSARPLNRSLVVFFSRGMMIALRRPRQAISFFRFIGWMLRAARLRARWKKRGVHVPPIVIFSVTNRCNLTCRGCYARSLHPGADDGIEAARLRTIVLEARDLGISFFVLTGGEPLLRAEMLDIAREVPGILFITFTNGLLIDEGMVTRLRKLRNMLPLLSLEGNAAGTDDRRGAGTHARLMDTMAAMRRAGIFFGASLTLTRANYSTLTDERYVGDLIERGCRFLLYVEHTPTQEGTEDWVLTRPQSDRVPALMRSLRSRFHALFIAVPWDEQHQGRCLSSGRGFVHINAQGDVEPCPFAPYSDANVNRSSLKDALQSEFLTRLRSRPELSTYTGSGCALWKNRERVRSLLG